ncbi:Sugar phosphate isomerase/epimerase [Paenibacillus tianmuensis]|uniref:Sugar phosphate isomerase/epimerase n=1 Tax=Paenibacillus tianmuensis TaxID=624147 RepID=A0A1G4TMC3_9BACL|nr:TIM barrel protein [Paenibacillus tianmuensis]SCW82464.1 Sugar phosphate isomerase/epimerase [Paenibacillus tianmuensis]
MAKSYENKLCIGTILLERNRWAAERQPSYAVSDWQRRFQEDGFDGMELWENHALLADEREQSALEASSYVTIVNSYIGFEDGDEAERKREEAAALVKRLRAPAVKFNLGADPAQLPVYIANVKRWAEQLPADCRILCECHPGTLAEHPDAAAEILRRFGDRSFQAIVHPFCCLGELEDWFKRLGSAITHAHVQLRDEDNHFIRVNRRPELVKDRLALMRRMGFRGSFTLEFTEGIHVNEDREALYEAALEDLQILRNIWNGNPS